jgi:signal transduction histidine kinase/CheY-like chemotaxis protein/HPt (histidine-containing phosphotransfer) domain-containing protein
MEHEVDAPPSWDGVSDLASKPRPSSLKGRQPLSKAQWETLAAEITHRHTATMAFFAGLGYFGIALSQWGSFEPFILFGLTGIALLASAWRTRREPPPLEWSLHIAGAIFVAIVASLTLTYSFSHNPDYLYVFALIEIAAAALLHSRPWLVAVVVLSGAGWSLVSLSMDDVDWAASYGFLLGVSCIVAGLHVTRRGTLVRLQELRLAAERAALARTEFLANMSHEIRTPMAGVVGLTSLLLDTKLEPAQWKIAAGIRESANALLTVVDEILDLSKLENGQVRLEDEVFDLSELTESVSDLMRPRAESKGLLLQRELVGFDDTLLRGDPARLRQVLLNLVNNAINFTEWGYVLIRAEKRQSEGERVRFRLSVRDTGVGIPQEEISTIFERYQRLGEETTKRLAGNGLGLAISKQLVELMGGEIGVSSSVDEGTTFWFELELEPKLGPRTTRIVSADPCIAGARVLIAEDDPTNRMVTEALLRKLKCEVEIAEDGAQAVELAQGRDYQIVFMDCYMPVMDGFEATRRIRATKKGARLPIAALTASVTEQDRARCLEAGMNEVIGKPIRIEALQAALERLIAGRIDATHEREATPLILDVDIIRQLVSLDGQEHDWIEEVMSDYIKQLRESIERLHQAAGQGDMKELWLTAHSIKGASKQLGATRVGALLGRIEREAELERAKALVHDLSDEVPRIEEAVRQLLSRGGVPSRRPASSRRGDGARRPRPVMPSAFAPRDAVGWRVREPRRCPASSRRGDGARRPRPAARTLDV